MTLADRTINEKRDFIRIRVNTPVSFTITGKTERYEGHCRDLSGAGMLLETEKKLVSGNQLTIVIPSERPEFSHLNAKVEVVRVEMNKKLHTYCAGVTIKQIQP